MATLDQNIITPCWSAFGNAKQAPTDISADEIQNKRNAWSISRLLKTVRSSDGRRKTVSKPKRFLNAVIANGAMQKKKKLSTMNDHGIKNRAVCSGARLLYPPTKHKIAQAK